MAEAADNIDNLLDFTNAVKEIRDNCSEDEAFFVTYFKEDYMFHGSHNMELFEQHLAYVPDLNEDKDGYVSSMAIKMRIINCALAILESNSEIREAFDEMYHRVKGNNKNRRRGV